MDIKNKTIVVLGGWGLVGNAVIRRLIPEKPKKIITTSLKKEEVKEQIAALRKEFPSLPKNYFIPWWGNVLVRNEFKDKDRSELLKSPKSRKIMIEDVFEDLKDEILHASSLYQLIKKYKPEIIIDCINTATGIAYQDVYTNYRRMKLKLFGEASKEEIKEEAEIMLASMYIPQLIRHIQILYNSMHEAKTSLYFKIGTSGTGGMGLNIPYTHSEERPSRVLLSKSAVAGAHSLLLFLMARTPDMAITKEIKPAAAIAWKKIAFGSIRKRGKEIELFDLEPEKSIKLDKTFSFNPKLELKKFDGVLKSVFIDTGENGIFSRGEFEAISAQKQMEFVTPEEIANNIVFEIKGGNTGRDIINALDNATLQPSYRAGYMQHLAVEKLAELEKANNKYSVAFEMLGPPRLSKLLYEIHILKILFGKMKEIIKQSSHSLSIKAEELLKKDAQLRSEILSIGIPILFSDGKTFLRGKEMKIPVFTGQNEIQLTPQLIDKWAASGWVDLREKNMRFWKKRLNELIEEAERIPIDDTSSLHVRTKQYWNNFEEIDIGKVVSWIFIHEEKGKRMKD